MFETTPGHGPLEGGTLVTVYGHEFLPEMEYIVTFGGIPATDLTYIDEGTFTCISPAKADEIEGFVDIIIDDGVNPITNDQTIPNGFRYGDLYFTHTSTPISSAQAHGPLSGNTAFTIHGKGFDDLKDGFGNALPTLEVQVNGIDSDVWSVWSDTQLDVISPPSEEAGEFDVNIFLDGGVIGTIFNGYKYDDNEWHTTPGEEPDGAIKYGPLLPGDIPIAPPIYIHPIIGEFLFPAPGIIPPGPWIPWIPTEPIVFIGTPIITPIDIIPILEPNPIPVIFNPIPESPPIEFTPILPFIPEEEPDPEGLIIPDNPIQTDNGYTINVGGAAIMVFIEDPSGIYTLIPGQTHDTLYDRTGLTPVDVKIPNPFVVTGFMGQ